MRFGVRAVCLFVVFWFVFCVFALGGGVFGVALCWMFVGGELEIVTILLFYCFFRFVRSYIIVVVLLWVLLVIFVFMVGSVCDRFLVFFFGLLCVGVMECGFFG